MAGSERRTEESEAVTAVWTLVAAVDSVAEAVPRREWCVRSVPNADALQCRPAVRPERNSRTLESAATQVQRRERNLRERLMRRCYRIAGGASSAEIEAWRILRSAIRHLRQSGGRWEHVHGSLAEPKILKMRLLERFFSPYQRQFD